MVAHPRLILSILYTLSLILCHSICRYNEPYILWNNTAVPEASGYYVRDYLDLVQSGQGTPFICGDHDDTTFNGSWIYKYDRHENETGLPTLYLFRFHSGGNSRLMISKKPCAQSNAQYDTDSSETSPYFDGTQCDWTLIDDVAPTPIPWRSASTTTILPGKTILCDKNHACNTNLPTTTPTMAPVPTTAIPTSHPTTPDPSKAPTIQTDTPTKTPTKSPTVKPTHLPTVVKPLFIEPPCVAMIVSNLDKAFPRQAEYQEKFNELNSAYNQRRVWSNGGGKLEIFYTKRYEPGRWVVSNGTYHLINEGGDQLVNGGVNQSFPGDDTGHGLYDHFPNDNPVAQADEKYTLRFVCQNSSIYGTRYPSKPPSPAPSLAPTVAPSLTPSEAPTLAPSAACYKMIFRNRMNKQNDTNNACPHPTNVNSTTPDFIETNLLFARYGKHNNHTFWKRQEAPPQDFELYYSNVIDAWVLWFKHHNQSEHRIQALVNPQPPGLEVPPPESEWYYVKHVDLFIPVCSIWVIIECYDDPQPTRAMHTTSPSPAPSVSPTIPPIAPPTLSPTTPPSLSPSTPPTAAPTGSPTLLCGGLTVGIDSNKFPAKYDFFRGNYRRSDDDDLIADHYWWQSREHSGARIYYSDISFHNTWVIHNKEGGSSYWLYPDYDHNLYYLQPPLSAFWEYYTGDSIFARDVATISFNCSLSLLPTADPTISPSMTPTQPPSLSPSITPTLSPSLSPSFAPSLAPTNHPTTPAPTNAPSLAPSFSPTIAPTREVCDFMQVVRQWAGKIYAPINYPHELMGVYNIIPNGRNGFSAWNMSNEYGTYLIEKKLGLYWVINKMNENSSNLTHGLTNNDLVSKDNNYNWRPPVTGKWWWYVQTDAPTAAPSSFTQSPTQPPSIAPTSTPTTDPTIEPTTDPTIDPTIEPTFEPTFEPTQTTHNPTSQPTINPTFEPTFDPSHEPTKEPTTGPTNEPTLEPTQTPIISRRRNLLQTKNQHGWEFDILMDCVNTGSPTYSPTTSEPTKAPTSNCEALRIATNSNSNYFWLGEYVRMDYLINNKPWFIATHGNSTLEFIGGLWTIMRRDRDLGLGHDEDPVLIYRNETDPNPLTWLLQSQFDKAWYDINKKYEVIIDVICMGSIPPTPSPTFSPSQAPTYEIAPVWMNCEHNWFTFVTMDQYNEINNATYEIYWDVPIAIGENIGNVEVDIIEESTSIDVFLNATMGSGEIMMEGDNLLDFGVYTILYRAYNVYNNDSNPLTSDCEIKLYVIGNTFFDTSDYCYNQKFTVDIAFNETFYEIEDFTHDDSTDDDDDDSTKDDDSSEPEYELDLRIDIEGWATNTQLRELNQKCYIYAKQLINVTEIISETADSSKYLGIEANALVWDFLIIIVLLCLFGLCFWRLYMCRKKYKENKENEAHAQALLPNKSERVMSGDSNHDDDDLAIGDINPNAQVGGDSGNPLLANKPKHQPGSLSDDDNHNGKKEWQKSQSIDENQGNETYGGTKGGDQAINALIGDAFDDDNDSGDGGYVTRGGGGGDGGDNEGGGGNVEMQLIHNDSLDQVGDLPNEDNEQSEQEPIPAQQPPPIPPPVPPIPPQQQPQEMPPVFDNNDDDYDMDDDDMNDEEENSEFDDDSEFEFRV